MLLQPESGRSTEVNPSAEETAPPIGPVKRGTATLHNALSPERGKEKPRRKQQGLSSWYGKRFHGKKTASGEPFDMHAMTAAHRTLPLQTWVRVTNLANGKKVTVRINDRGPHLQSRIIDVSQGAAKALGFSKKGLARVEVEVLPQNEAEQQVQQ